MAILHTELAERHPKKTIAKYLAVNSKLAIWQKIRFGGEQMGALYKSRPAVADISRVLV